MEPSKEEAAVSSETALMMGAKQKLALSTVPRNLEEWKERAKGVAESGLVPDTLKGKPAACMIVLTKGAELGLMPMQTLESIDVIYGRTFIRSSTLHAMVEESGKSEYFREVETKMDGSEGYSIWETKRIGHPEPTRETFTLEDARRMGLLSKKGGNWDKDPKIMLSHRARSRLARKVYPDVTLGMYSIEEAEDFRERPQTIEAELVPEDEAKSKLEKFAQAKRQTATADEVSEPEILMEDDEEPESEGLSDDEKAEIEAQEASEVQEDVIPDPGQSPEEIGSEHAAQGSETMPLGKAAQLTKLAAKHKGFDAFEEYLRGTYKTSLPDEVPVGEYERIYEWIMS